VGFLSVPPFEALPDLTAIETRDLFALYRQILRELKTRGVVRTENAPTGDYADYLVASSLNGVLAPNSEKSWDVRLPNGDRIQVKCRVAADPPRASQRQLSPFRSFEFEAAVIVLLRDDNFDIWRAAMVPSAVIESNSRYRSHVNGHVAFATAEILDHPLAVDLTDQLREASIERRPE
jgi:hypothetical protein